MTEFDDSDIAIVGMALRVPGASTPEQYWANLRDGVESLVQYSEADLLARGVSRGTLADPNYVRAGMPLQEVDQFDPDFFGFSAKEAAILDPQHRQFYEVAWEALERAGHPPARFDGAVGVFAGCGMGAYFTWNLLSNADLVDSVGLFLLRHTGNDKDFLSTRVSYAFNLKGPSISVQTACSTSLVAVHLGVQSLLAGECDLVLAGGATIELPHAVGYHYKEGEILSPDGHCRAFDHRSKGTVFGSGTGVVVLRRLRDALDDGDHIHAIVKGSAINNDGSQKVGYLAPSVDGQAAAVAEALAVADLGADTISYVECHGTGTPVGDPIEIAALTRAFRETTEAVGFCRVGSVKTNIGHLDTAAGVASLIKATLALENRQIPPSLNFEAPNPAIAFEGSPFVVADRLADWKAGGTPRRAGVNSLGVGGTNAFVIVQEAPERSAAPIDGPQVIALSTKNRKALDAAGLRLADWLEQNPGRSLADVSHSLLRGRHAFEHRRVLACSTPAEAVALLRSGDARRVYTHSKETERLSPVFMYPGGGAQYFRMGAGLYEREPVFREQMDQGLKLLATKFDIDLRGVFLARDVERREIDTELAKPSVQLPLIFLIEYALTKLWAHYGVVPKALIGHSMGENTAACVAGVFSFEDGLGLVRLRGQLMDDVPAGGMLSVTLPAHELKAHLGAELDLACANSPQLSIASGRAELLDRLEARLKGQGIESQRVKINIAAHSRLLEGILEPFRRYLRSIRLGEPQVPIVSNRTGKWLDPARARDPEYWVEHLRNTVLFADGVDTLLEADDRVFIEVGPGSILGSFVRQNPRAPTQRVFGSLRHPEDATPDDAYFRTILGRMWAVGGEIDLDKLWPRRPSRIPLPTYPFQHSRYWIEPGAGAATAERDVDRPLRLEDRRDWFREPVWIQQGILEESDAPCTWLVFHTNNRLSLAVLAELRELGHRVVSVENGDTFARIDEHRYTIAAEAGGSGYQELIESLGESGLMPDRILHAWLLTTDQTFRPGSSFFHRNQEYGFYSLFYLARALSKAGATDRPLSLLVVANGAQQVRDEATPFPEKATALGPCAVIPREFPQVACRFVDVRLPTDAGKPKPAVVDAEIARLTGELVAETRASPESGVVAWRGGVRHERHLRPYRPAAAAATERLRQNGVYLITGGFGGIGSSLATHLARTKAARLVLVGRTPLPRREDWDQWLAAHDRRDSISRAIQTIRQIEGLGGSVLPLAADVTVAEQMQEAVDQARKAWGRIDGVFHTAGVIRDSLIPLKHQRDIEDVFAAKVYGTRVLDDLFRDSDLGFMILFSSTSVYIAPQGQIDYVGANAFMNAFADSCRGHRPYPVTAVNWGIWKDVGMVGAGKDSAGDIDTSHASAAPANYPLFEEHLSAREGVDQVHVFTGNLSAERDWMIDDHRLSNGDALLPGTGYIELIRAALAEVGETDAWRMDQLVFLNPLYVDNGKPRRFRVRLKGQRGRWEAEILGGLADGQSWEPCALARVGQADAAAPARVDIAAIRKRCDGPSESAGGTSALRTTQEAHLNFGPRWRVLRRLQHGRAEALAELRLADEYAAELAGFSLHPGLLDIATGCGMRLIPGYAEQETAQNLWVPISYRSFRYFHPLPAQVMSWIRLSGDSSTKSDFAAFDVTLCDEQGLVLAEVQGLSLRQLPGTLRKPLAAAPLPTAEGAPRSSPARKLSAGELALEHNRTQGILATEGIAALETVLSGAMPSELVVSSMDPAALIAQAGFISKAAAGSSSDAKFARPELDSDFEAPRNELEKGIAEIWSNLLGVETIGIHDSFFDLGGHSLIAVRLFNTLSDRYGADLPMSVLMQSPTVAALAELIGPEAGGATAVSGSSDAATTKPAAKLKYSYVVPMHSGAVGGGTPLFVVAGMFGNVLNLSHLAHLLGEDRPFYALQARGLYGDTPPHESFEEAAADYLQEIRQVQPEGPYLLGGFSGGGLIAFEIANQLIQSGERVAAVVMLDTPVPRRLQLSTRDKLSMFVQGAKHNGMKYLLEKVKTRIRWEQEKLARRLGKAGRDSQDPMRFQSNRIGDAFLRALHRYDIPKLPVSVALFRPKLKVRFQLSGGRRLDVERNYLSEDNGWTPFVAHLDIFEVPGTHDSMVLEPNVRVLVSSLKRHVDEADAGRRASQAV